MNHFRTFLFLALIILVFSCSTKVANFTVSPGSHNFGQVNIGDSATFDFIITNKKSVDITLTVVNFTTGEFAEITAAQGKIITAKETLLITVQFTPTLPGGTKADKMLLEWTDINGKSGTKNVELKGDAIPVPEINAPTTYDFGTVGLGQTATHNFSIENTGTADLILSLFNFNGNATLFSITAGGVTPVTIIPGATHIATVQFAPVATGSFPTVLEISHNAVNPLSPLEINIAAQGGGGRIELNQTSPWDFDAVSTGLGGKIDVLEISNTGSINLNINDILLTTGQVFSIEKLDDSSGNPITMPFAIAVGDFVEVTIKFNPTTQGNFNDTLEIENDGSYTPSPATINLIGSGRDPVTQTFNYTGSMQTWTVPAGVNSIIGTALGAQGGTNANSIGGKGGRAIATIPVTPAESLNIYVGGQGTPILVSTTGGFNGGGGTNAVGSGIAGTGGGASDIRRGTALANRVLVAGGGGGCGAHQYALPGGYGGGLTGGTGQNWPNWANGGGRGGTQTAGGARGVAGGGCVPYDGAFGEGGRGCGDNAGGGGGGGGWYGGGGGIYSGGGGGSSYVDASGNTNQSTTQDVQTGNGSIQIQY